MTPADGIDNFDQLLRIFGSQNHGMLRLEAGNPAQIIGADGDSQDVSGRVLTRQEILAMVSPIVPEHARRQLPKEPSVSFDYISPSIGPLKLTMARDTERLIVTVVSDNPGDPEPEAPEPSPVAKQPPPAPAVQPPTPAIVAGPPIDRLFRAMAAAGASDLHLSVGMPPLVRKDGRMQPLEEGAPALDPTSMQELLRPIVPDKNAAEFGARHDTDFAYEIAGLARFRANIFEDRKGPGAVFRVIPNAILTAEQLGLSTHILQLCNLTKGLVLVTGPTGSGKSTTLCAMVDYINRNRDDHIITIEDPIEFVHENRSCLINQREVGTHTDSFKGALRAALREDPDIILVGEMRDLETVAIAIETAETGHLVFGTLHTTTAASTVDRIIGQFPSERQAQIRVMLSESLRGVISQTLCRKIGGGRIAALEVLIVTSAVSNLIREGKTFQLPSIMQVGKAVGMVSLNDALMELVTQKIVAPEEAYQKSVDKTSFEGLLKRAGIDTKFALGATP
jgi:twitching motility protein PilT